MEPAAASKKSKKRLATGADAAGKTKKKKKRKEKLPEYLKAIVDKKLKGKLTHRERITKEAGEQAAKIDEWLKPLDAGYIEAEGLERTYRFKQDDIVQHVEQGAAKKVLELKLHELGPYSIDFTRNGKYMLLGGSKGHLAMFDWQHSRLECEVQVAESTYDVQFLHNELFFAAAQRKYIYIYDKRGVEVHCLRDHTDARRLQFLPHHFLLTSIGETGTLRYQDTSTGQIVAQHKTRLGPCDVLRQNPHNAIMCCGHAGGTVTMWSPNITTPVVKLLCHRGPVKALAVDASGRHLVTSGVDGQVKVWDIRTYQPLHAYFANTPATQLDISQRGLLAVGQGRRVQVWKEALQYKQQSPYMTHNCELGTLRDFAFCPYEDVLGMGSSQGVSTMLVPGAGEPNFDSFVANPYQTRKQRQEQEVVLLLDKLAPTTIMLDPEAVGGLRREPAEVQRERAREQEEANQRMLAARRNKNDTKTKVMGKNKPTRRHRKKQQNVIDDRNPTVRKRIAEQDARKAAKAAAEEQAAADEAPRALQRFYKR